MTFRFCFELDEAIASAVREHPSEKDIDDIIEDNIAGALFRNIYSRVGLLCTLSCFVISVSDVSLFLLISPQLSMKIQFSHLQGNNLYT